MKRMVIIAGLAIAGLSVAACGAATHTTVVRVTQTVTATPAPTPTPSGFNNPVTLAASVQSTFNTPANKAKDGFNVSGTSCIANSGGNTFTCIITETPGGQQTLTVTVAADGSTWISKADS
jgi:hypothetical protein